MIPTVVALRQKLESIRLSEIERLDFKLSSLPPDARELARDRVDEITHLIVEKLLLMPTEQLKTLTDVETMATYSEALTRLFGLAPAEPDAERSSKVEPFTRKRGPR